MEGSRDECGSEARTDRAINGPTESPPLARRDRKGRWRAVRTNGLRRNGIILDRLQRQHLVVARDVSRVEERAIVVTPLVIAGQEITTNGTNLLPQRVRALRRRISERHGAVNEPPERGLNQLGRRVRLQSQFLVVVMFGGHPDLSFAWSRSSERGARSLHVPEVTCQSKSDL